MMFPPNTRVMVIDDMMTMRKLVVNNLRDLGYFNITEAIDGQDAWKKLTESQHAFGLIISDWNMPNLSGLELLQKCKGDDRFKKVPFVMLTAEAEQHQVIAALKGGVSNYIIKPFTPDVLKEKLEQAYKKSM